MGFSAADQNVAEVEFGAGVVLIANLLRRGFNFLRQNGNTATYFVVTHLPEISIFADLITIGVVVNTVMEARRLRI